MKLVSIKRYKDSNGAVHVIIDLDNYDCLTLGHALRQYRRVEAHNTHRDVEMIRRLRTLESQFHALNCAVEHAEDIEEPAITLDERPYCDLHTSEHYDEAPLEQFGDIDALQQVVKKSA